jgi:hypothetical protein
MRMSSIFKATIRGKPSEQDEIKVKRKRSKDYVDGEIGIVLDIFDKTINNFDESLILGMLEGYAFDNLNNIKVKLTRHHYTLDNPRTEVQVFAMNDVLESWWEDIEIMTTRREKLN